jgi:hypothetical protein
MLFPRVNRDNKLYNRFYGREIRLKIVLRLNTIRFIPLVGI